MRLILLSLGLLGIMATTSALLAAPRESTVTQQGTNVFWSGHSLTDPPIPEMLADISAGFGVPMRWNRHSMAGASMEARTRGRPANMNGWDGYRQGNNRDSVDMDVIKELRTAATVGGNGYDVLVITEVNQFLWSVLRGDTVRLLRHYHERFMAGNPSGQTFFYQSWGSIYDKQDPQAWIAYERAAEPVWQCIATRVNTSLTAEGRSDQLRFLPASLSLVALVERATSGTGVPGISADTVPATLNRIFRDTAHLTDTGAYYIGLVSYAFIEARSPVGAWAPPGMNRELARALQNIAWRFYVDYRDRNAPLTLSACSALVRDSFAERFWRFIVASKGHNDLPWYSALWHNITGPIRIRRNTQKWQAGFAEDNPENPFRFEPDSDTHYWHQPP
jgi:hypothetical protein